MWIRNTLLVPCLNTLKASNRFPWIPFSLSHYSDIPIKKPKVAPLQERKMVDRFRLRAKGGDGGNGCCSFRRSRNDPRGKPDGGNGGRGGDVILECSVAVWDLSNLQHHLNASRGGHGVSKNKIGKRGTDKVMQVPVGTVVHLVQVADIPGLIKGAHENRGLGHAFLRHIERTKVLAYVVDLASALDGRNGIHPWEQLRDLVLELEYYQEGLSIRPSLVVANKIDEEGTNEVYEELKRRVQGVPIYPVCAVLEEGITELKAGLRRLVDGTESWRLDLDGINID